MCFRLFGGLIEKSLGSVQLRLGLTCFVPGKQIDPRVRKMQLGVDQI